jgi:hypothetical protein
LPQTFFDVLLNAGCPAHGSSRSINGENGQCLRFHDTYEVVVEADHVRQFTRFSAIDDTWRNEGLAGKNFIEAGL